MLYLMTNGGIVVSLLLLFSLTALTIALYKAWHFWGHLKIGSSLPSQAIDQIEHQHQAQALLLVSNGRNPRAELIKTTLHLINDSALNLEQAKTEATRKARQLAAQLQNYLRPLEVIATLAPLLGLFGTVLGMIEAFQAMESAGSQVNPAVLSGGIWQALLTTAVGLAVAIPTSLIHSFFDRRAEVETLALQNDLEQLFTLQAITQQRGTASEKPEKNSQRPRSA